MLDNRIYSYETFLNKAILRYFFEGEMRELRIENTMESVLPKLNELKSMGITITEEDIEWVKSRTYCNESR